MPGLLRTCAALAVLVAGCGAAPSQGRIVQPTGPVSPPAWTEAERQKDVAVRTLRVSDTVSIHLVRLAGAEKPHVHDSSDLFVFVLRGSVRMHFGESVFPVSAGEVIEIPRGAPHWAENSSDSPSEAYVIFSPPMAPPGAKSAAGAVPR